MAKITSPILKNGLYAMAALVLAGSTLVVKATSTNVRADYNWYLVDGTGTVQQNPIDPNTVCIGSGQPCAIGLDRDHFALSANDQSPINSLSELSSEDQSFTMTAEKD